MQAYIYIFELECTLAKQGVCIRQREKLRKHSGIYLSLQSVCVCYSKDIFDKTDGTRTINVLSNLYKFTENFSKIIRLLVCVDLLL